MVGQWGEDVDRLWNVGEELFGRRRK